MYKGPFVITVRLVSEAICECSINYTVLFINFRHNFIQNVYPRIFIKGFRVKIFEVFIAEIVQTLHVKFFTFGSLLPFGTVSVSI